MLKVFRHIDELLTLKPAFKKKARHIQEKDLGLISKASLISYNGKIVWVGKDSQLKTSFLKSFTSKKPKEYSFKNLTVMPSFVESHTHLIFGGERQEEFEKRNQGASYQEIAKKGGGILSTVKATRKLSKEKLIIKAQKHTDRFLRQGVGTLEMKTGYALDLKNELKMIKVAKALKGPRKVITFLGLHAVPMEFSSAQDYTLFVIKEVLPKVASLVDRADVFVEKGYFSTKQTERFLKACQDFNLPFTLHTEQMTLSYGYQLALRYKAQSADHLVCLNSQGVSKMAASPVTATLLPASDFYLKCAYPPARKLLNSGARVALATDFNPGSCPTQDLSLVGVLARLEMNMSLPEVITAYTLGGAYALGLQKEIGSLEVGKSCDFVVLDDSYKNLFYQVGHHPVRATFNAGKQLFSSLKTSGQVAIEYILLLLVLVALAVVLVEMTVSFEENEEGFIINKWKAVVQTIGSDIIDE